jgi:hypothetical protein
MSATLPRRLSLRLAVGMFVVIGVVASLYLARAFFVPLLIGILASYALTPFVDWLKAWRVPRVAGAALVLGAKTGNYIDEVDVIYKQAMKVSIKSNERDITVAIDGEPIGILPATFQVNQYPLNLLS